MERDLAISNPTPFWRQKARVSFVSFVNDEEQKQMMINDLGGLVTKWARAVHVLISAPGGKPRGVKQKVSLCSLVSGSGVYRSVERPKDGGVFLVGLTVSRNGPVVDITGPRMSPGFVGLLKLKKKYHRRGDEQDGAAVAAAAAAENTEREVALLFRGRPSSPSP